MTQFCDFSETFMNHCRTHLKPETVRQYSHILNSILTPAFGNRSLSDVRRADVHALHVSMAEKPVMANRVVAVGKSMYGLAQRLEVFDGKYNPFSKIRFYKEELRDRFLSNEEYERLGQALSQLKREGRFSEAALGGIRLLAMTGARRSEMESLKWSEVDLINGEIRLEDSKTGPRTIEVSSPVRQVLESLPRTGEFVLADRCGRRVGLRAAWNQVRVMAGISDVRMHDLRHSYATHAAMNGVAVPVIAELLGHSTVWTTTRYLHVSRGYVSQAAEQVSASISGLTS